VERGFPRLALNKTILIPLRENSCADDPLTGEFIRTEFEWNMDDSRLP
jgi:hypothetical protein